MSREVEKHGATYESTHRTHGTTHRSTREGRDLLYMVGGAVLMVLGAGLLLSTPVVRRMLGNLRVGDLIRAAVPNLERYVKL